MAASPEDVAKGVKMAEQEMDYRVDLFNRQGHALGNISDEEAVIMHVLVGLCSFCGDKSHSLLCPKQDGIHLL